MRRAGLLDWLARRPLVAFSTAAGLFAIGYGVYLYLQITNPGMFVAQPSAPPPAPSIATAPRPPEPVAPGLTPPAAPQTPIPPASSLAPPPIPLAPAGIPSTAAEPAQPAPAPAYPAPPTVARIDPAAPPVSDRMPERAPVAAAPRAAAIAPPAGSIAPAPASPAPPAAAPRARPPANEGAEIASTEPSRTMSPPAEPAATRAPRPAAKAAATRAGREPVESVATASTPALVPVDANIASAYQALEQGRLDEAERMYRQALASDGRNQDAMLGLASTLAQQQKRDAASQLYLRVLEQDPRNAYAQAGLLNLGGRADPIAAEARLKQLIAREPSAFLYFSLGNLYSEQGQWAAAQSAYFQAHNLAPDNPDYAFNLAVGLEHLSQPRIALDYYRRAVALAQARGHAQFELARVENRIRSLEATLAQRP
jgi:Tfp pilus assembly protein PilF